MFQNVYEETLPLYFPRSPQEEKESLTKLPSDIGNEMGEPVIPERQIRIMDKPTLKPSGMNMHCYNTLIVTVN